MEAGPSASARDYTREPANPTKCEACAAVKRLKTAASSSGDSSADGSWYAKQPCTCWLTQVNDPPVAPPQVAGMAAASPSDMLRPRRLFDDDDADGDGGTVLCFDAADAVIDASDHQSTSIDTYEGAHSIEDAEFSFLRPTTSVDTYDASPEDEAEFALIRAAASLGDLQGAAAVSFEGTQCSSVASPLLRPASAPPVPVSPSPVFGSATAVAFMGNYSRTWAPRGPSPPPPPPLPASSLDAARYVAQSPGLMLAGARMEIGRRAMTPASSTASSCATPSRAPLPLRPPTPGAPGSIRRSCSLFIDGLDDLDVSPGATPERSASHGGPVAMSLTDTALLQLTESMSQQLSIGPVGGKRSFEERDGMPAQ